MNKILLLGSGALQIGQAGEFDYSGSQAIKALKEENIEVILINPNIATIQTSKGLADRVYFLPVNIDFVTKVIDKERPDGIMLSFGGQTALNCGIDLYKKGVFKKYKVSILGTPLKTILETEDRDLFRKKMQTLKLSIAKSIAISSIKDSEKAANKIGYPLMIRSAYSLGGLGSAVVFNKIQMKKKARLALTQTGQVLFEEYLSGWKEIEYEVVRDVKGNKITVCNMENMDPMGIHTGESVVVAPSQTLTNEEYFKLRRISLDCIEGLGIIGECNIQFALNPKKFEYRIIEVNARLSRSSALASKATGYPLAFVAAKLALGYDLSKVKNSVTKTTTAFFEPALDYIVIKVPRWDLSKFTNVDKELGSEMKSVGEIMAIGRTFPEAIQKAARMLDIGYLGILPRTNRRIDYSKELSNPTPERPFIISKALLKGLSVEKIYELSKVDKWFIYQLKLITDFYRKLKSKKRLSKDLLLRAKKYGFSDAMLGFIFNKKETAIRKQRIKYDITPFIKKIDTLAGEFPAKTNYLYLTYNAAEHDFDIITENRDAPTQTVGILGGGPYRIGSSVEFDWCAVNTAWEFNKYGYKTVIINCNPETVSTDYDISNKLYFEELTFERVLDIAEFEKIPLAVSMGGQTSNNLAVPLKKSGVKILGTSPENIDQAEDRDKFSTLLDQINIQQPEWYRVKAKKDAEIKAIKLGYPVLMRPSYVLSGEAMFVAFNNAQLKSYLQNNIKRGIGFPLIMTKYYEDAKEVDIDGVATNGKLLNSILLEHVENAGVHSGDATLIYPSHTLKKETQYKLIEQTKKIARKLNINGPFNIQYLVKNNDTKVIECNLRASRSFPFSSKATNSNLIKLAVKSALNIKPEEINKKIKPVMHEESSYIAIKAPQFSFSRLRGADPVLRVEMASTGEVACFGPNLHETYLKAVLSTNVCLPKKGVLLSLGGYHAKRRFLTSALLLKNLGFNIYSTEGTSHFLNDFGLEATCLYKMHEGKQPSVLSAVEGGYVDLVINTSEKPDVGTRRFKNQLSYGYLIRRAVLDNGIHIITNLKSAELFVESMAFMNNKEFEIKSWNEYTEN